MWDMHRQRLCGDTPVVFDRALRLTTPELAKYQHVFPVMADLNPFPVSVEFSPGSATPWQPGSCNPACRYGEMARTLDLLEAGKIAIPPEFADLAAARYELQRSVPPPLLSCHIGRQTAAAGLTTCRSTNT